MSQQAAQQRKAQAAYALVELSYRSAASDRQWLQGIAESAQPLMEELGALVTGSLFRVDVPAGFELLHFVGSEEQQKEQARCVEAVSPAIRLAVFASGPIVALSERLPPTAPMAERVWNFLREVGVGDILGFNCRDTGPIGCNISFRLPRAAHVDAPMRGRIARASAHVATALRLRLRRGRDEAVLDPAGRCLHAEEPAKAKGRREALARAVQARDQGRILAKRRADDALNAWASLIEGRWSLIEQFDSDGRRFWVARENEPPAQADRSLSELERRIVGYLCVGHSQKLIAYELGLSPATISKAIAIAKRKLHIRTTAQVVELYTRLHG